MKCLACDRILNDFEATRRFLESEEFVDLCNECFATIREDMAVSERDDLKEYEDYDTDSIEDADESL